MGAGWGRRGDDKRNDNYGEGYRNERDPAATRYGYDDNNRNDGYRKEKDRGFCAGRSRRDNDQRDDYRDGYDDDQRRLRRDDDQNYNTINRAENEIEAGDAVKRFEEKQTSTSLKYFMIAAPLSMFIILSVLYSFVGAKPVTILLEFGCYALSAVIISKVPFCTYCCGITDEMRSSSLYRWTGVLCILATLFGVWEGLCLNDRFFHPYWTYLMAPTYTNVLPSDLASARADAAIIGFDSQAVVDTFRSGSATSSDLTIFCVAPIFDYSGQSKAEFWAVGTDCCGRYGGFYCDDALDSSCKSGLVLRDTITGFAPPEYNMYMNAVKETAAKEHLQIPDKPVLLRWSKDVEGLKGSFLTGGIAHLLFGILFYGILSCGCGIFGERMEKAKGVEGNIREQQQRQRRGKDYY